MSADRTPRTSGSTLFVGLFIAGLFAQPAVASEADTNTAASGLAAVDAGDFASAVPLLEAAIRAQPDDALLEYALGIAHIELEDDESAVRALRRVAQLAPDFPGVEIELGMALYRLGDLDAAEEHLLDALLQGPEDPDVLLHLARIDLERGEFERAIRYFEETARLEPRVAAIAYLEAAGVALDRNDPEAAEAFLELTIAADGPLSARDRARELLAELRPAPLRRIALNAAAGVDYDDNLTVSAVDLTTGVGDVAAIFDTGIALIPIVVPAGVPTVEFAVGYDFRQSFYRTLTRLNLQSHSPFAQITLGDGRLAGLAAYRYTNDSLGGVGFLSTQRGDLGGEFAVTEWLVAVVGVRVEGLDFDQASARDALRTSLALGARVMDDADAIAIGMSWRPVWTNASGAEFDYHGDVVTTTLDFLTPLVPFAQRRIAFRFSYDWESRDYTSVTPDIGVRRQDERHQFGSGFAIPLIGPTEASFDYIHVSSSSNIPELNYGENILTFRVAAWY